MVYLVQQAQQAALVQPGKLGHLGQLATADHPVQPVALDLLVIRVQPGQLVALAAVAQQVPPEKPGQQA